MERYERDNNDRELWSVAWSEGDDTVTVVVSEPFLALRSAEALADAIYEALGV